MEWVEIAKYVALVVGLVAGVFLGWKEWKERKARASGLLPNPTRCEDHEGRLRKVEVLCVELGPKIQGLDDRLSAVNSGVNRLIDLHLSK